MEFCLRLRLECAGYLVLNVQTVSYTHLDVYKRQDKNVWRCNRCGAAGGMLALDARYNCTSNADAYREICEALGRYTPRPRAVSYTHLSSQSAENAAGA